MENGEQMTMNKCQKKKTKKNRKNVGRKLLTTLERIAPFARI